MRLEVSKLPYTYEKAKHGYRDLRQIEVWLPKRRFARISLNGIYRSSKARVIETRYANPGWVFGFERTYVNWTHFRRHCWHLCFNVGKRGITFSYGKRLV